MLLPANYFALDAIIPVLLPNEFVVDPEGKESIKPINPKVPNGVPEAVYQEDPIKHQGKSRYRPIYSFLGLQFKADDFKVAELPGMQSRLYYVQRGQFEKDQMGQAHRERNEALEQVFQHQITLLYSFKERQQVGDHSISVTYGPIVPVVAGLLE